MQLGETSLGLKAKYPAPSTGTETVARKSSLQPSAMSCARFKPFSPSQATKPRQWMRHSFRAGAAVDLVESGYSIEQVMRKGDWKSFQAELRYLMAD